MANLKDVTNMNMCRYTGSIDGDVIPSLILGNTGEKYNGRDVVMFNHVVGLFGTRKDGKDRIRKLTINNGILNQCALDNPPKPYWAILDAASTLKKNFTRSQVIELALQVFGEKRATADSTGAVHKGKLEKACEMAWDVLRNHHRHARKCNAGMTFMIDSEGGGKLSIRARCADETIQYFEQASARKKAMTGGVKLDQSALVNATPPTATNPIEKDDPTNIETGQV